MDATYFKTKIIGVNNDDPNELFCLLFSQQNIEDKVRNYKELVLIEIAWGQIISFIFKIHDRDVCEYFYCIDCVDLFGSLVIHFNILLHKSFTNTFFNLA